MSHKEGGEQTRKGRGQTDVDRRPERIRVEVSVESRVPWDTSSERPASNEKRGYPSAVRVARARSI
eukprot:767492-Hanusia_phi.AAC.8